ncbi:MAG: class I SAM-dependent methyltransferase [Candidatus Methylomirabilales bacterium]
MTERWKSYVTQGVQAAGGPIPFALSQWTFLFPIFLAIRTALPSGGKVLDVGCGAGTFTALLAHHGFQVVGVDEDPDIVAYAGEMVEYFRSHARVEQASAFDLSRYHGRFDLVYSLGVVEHFEPEVTVQLIREQARCARVVLVAVPTRFTRYTGPVTDERLYRRRQVGLLVRRAGLRVRELFIYGEVPSRVARNLERLLPGVIYRRMKHIYTYGMGICCVGERR